MIIGNKTDVVGLCRHTIDNKIHIGIVIYMSDSDIDKYIKRDNQVYFYIDNLYRMVARIDTFNINGEHKNRDEQLSVYLKDICYTKDIQL